MASAFPGGLDNFTNPSASDALDSVTVPHADQHSNANDAIEAIEGTLGVNPQGSSATVVARLTALDSTVAGKAPLASPALTGTPTTTTATVDTNTTQIASTAFVLAQAGSATPVVDGTATVGTSTRFARQDHIHPTDTSRAALASPTFTGTVTVPSPTNSTDAATKGYVDAAAQGLNVHPYVRAASTTNITGTYTAGTSDQSQGTGVGATFVFVAATVDGLTLVANDRVLLKNQSTATQNGIYTVTTVSTNITLTRAIDADNHIAGQVVAGDFVFVDEGSQANTGWVLDTAGTATTPAKGIRIGTDNISFTQFSGAGTYVAGTGLTLTGNSFAVNATLPSTTSVNNTTIPASSTLVTTATTSLPNVTSVNSTTIPASSTLVTTATTTLPNVTSVNSTTIPASSTLLTSTSTSSGLTSFGTDPTANTQAVDNNSTKIATTAFVVGQAGSATPVVNGTAAVGTSTRFARQDHVHPSDTSKLSLSGGTMTGSIAMGGNNISNVSNISLPYTGSSSQLVTLQNGNNSSATYNLPSGSGTATLIGSGDTGTVTSTMILDGTIVDADINASAAIATSKISGLDTALTNKQGSPLYYNVNSVNTFTNTSAPTVTVSPFSTSNSTLGVSVAANTTYLVKFQISMAGTSVAQSRNLGINFANSTCNTSAWSYQSSLLVNITQITPAVTTTASYTTNVSGTLVGDQSILVEPTATNAQTRYRLINLEGMFTTGSTAGKFIPQVYYTVNGETNIRFFAGTFITLTPLLGSSSNGTWS